MLRKGVGMSLYSPIRVPMPLVVLLLAVRVLAASSDLDAEVRKALWSSKGERRAIEELATVRHPSVSAVTNGLLRGIAGEDGSHRAESRELVHGYLYLMAATKTNDYVEPLKIAIANKHLLAEDREEAVVILWQITQDNAFAMQLIAGDDDVLRAGALSAIALTEDERLITEATQKARAVAAGQGARTGNALVDIRSMFHLRRQIEQAKTPDERVQQAVLGVAQSLFPNTDGIWPLEPGARGTYAMAQLHRAYREAPAACERLIRQYGQHRPPSPAIAVSLLYYLGAAMTEEEQKILRGMGVVNCATTNVPTLP